MKLFSRALLVVPLAAAALAVPAAAEAGKTPVAAAGAAAHADVVAAPLVPTSYTDEMGNARLRRAARALSSSLDPATTGGVAIDESGRSLVVLATPAGRRKAQVALRGFGAPGVTARVRPAARSLASLRKLQNVDVWKGGGLEGKIVSARVDVLRNRVVVGVTDTSLAVRRQLAASFGSAVAVMADRPAVATINRYDDRAPFWNGDRVLTYWSPAGGAALGSACSTGYTATYDDRDVIVTAGHCAPHGDGITTPTLSWSGAINGEGGCTTSTGCRRGASTSGGVAQMGTVWATGTRFYTTEAGANAGAVSADVAIIRGNGHSYAWKVGSNSHGNLMTTFPGAARTPNLLDVCHTGATSLGDCGTVGNGDTVRLFSGSLNGTTYYFRSRVWWAGGARTCGGDSGGLVFTGTNSIIGTVTGRTGASEPSIKGQGCSADLWFTYWGEARTRFPGITPKLEGTDGL